MTRWRAARSKSPIIEYDMHTNFPNNDKPQTFNGDLGALPAALVPLTKLPRWVVWRWVSKRGIWTKPPYQACNPQRNAANNNPSTWAAYEEAVAQVNKKGIGFNLLDGDIGAVDLDNCRDQKTGVIDEWAQLLIKRAPPDALPDCASSVPRDTVRKNFTANSTWAMVQGRMKFMAR
jgi:hypothetical protein